MLMTRDVRRIELIAAFWGAVILVPTFLLDSVTDVMDSLLTLPWLIGGVLFGGAIVHGFWRRSHRGEQRRLYRARGWASAYHFSHVFGRRAIMRLAKFIRPSLERKGLARLRLRRRPVTDYAMRVGRAVTGNIWVRWRTVWASFEKCLLVIAPMGAGKTSWLIDKILDAPGGLLVASTKPDLYEHTAELRRQRGPVALFNPQGVGGLGSDFTWDPLEGCENPRVATARAYAFVQGTKALTQMDEASWLEKSADLIAKLLMAARLGNRTIEAVAGWLNRPNDDTPVLILRKYAAQIAPTWADNLAAELDSKADKMKASMFSLARNVFAFLGNDRIARMCRSSDRSLDITDFVLDGGTLYLLGDDKDESIAPLLSALVTHVYDSVKLAADLRNGRNDPPFGFILDEAAKITLVPLNQWAADLRAFGGFVIAVFQTIAQLRQRWGADGAEDILGLFSRVILGGITNIKDLKELSELAGKRPGETSVNDLTNIKFKDHTLPPQPQPLIAPDQIRQLPRGRALVILGEASPVIIKYKKGQDRAKKELKRLAARESAGRDDAPDTEETESERAA